MVDSYTSSPFKGRRTAGRGAMKPYANSDIFPGRRNRGGKKNYVVDSTEDDDEPEEDEEMDAEGEEDDDLEDADGEADADGDVDMEVTPIPASKKAAQPPKGILKSATVPVDDDDDELSDPNMDTANFDYESAEEDAEGEDDDVDATIVGSKAAVDEDDEFDSEEDIDGRTDPMDLSRMTKRQRARFAEEDDDGSFLKLSDEVQVKKHFTAEELSMRRTEMARRRRNLSDKRNEEVKMETINKLLKKQAPKTNKKAKTAEEEAAEEEARRPDPTMIRWVSSKNGVTLSVPDAILESPLNEMFKKTMKPSGGKRLIEEVS